MISHKNKFIFIHTPKTGGTSMRSYFNSLDKNTINAGHKTIANIHKYYVKGKLVGDNSYDISKYYTFMFVRNPWDRFVSSFFYLKNLSTSPTKIIPPTLSKVTKVVSNYRNCPSGFRSFVKNLNFKKKFNINHDYFVHFKPQIFFINRQSSYNINFIGKFENLQEDFNIVCDQIGIPRPYEVPSFRPAKEGKLPHRNPTKHKNYTEYYNDETREIIAKKYAKDIEYFGYKFGE